MAADRGRQWHSVARRPRRPGWRRAGRSRRSGAGGFRRARTLPIDFQWLRSPWPDELFSLTDAPGIPSPVRAGDRRQPVQTGARRAPAAGALLQRIDHRRVRAAALPADGRPDLLLQRREVPLPVHLDGRRGREARAGDVGAARPAASGRVHPRRSRFRRPSPSSCASKSTTTGCGSRYRSAAATGRGFRSSSTPASSPTKRPRRACRTSRARSSAWPARTCPAHGASGGFRLVRVRRAALPDRSVRAARLVSLPLSGTAAARTP